MFFRLIVFIALTSIPAVSAWGGVEGVSSALAQFAP